MIIARDRTAYYRARAQLYAAEGEWEKSFQDFRHLVDLLVEMEMPWYKAQALRVWADAHLRRAVPEDIDQVRELLEEARSIFTGLGIEYYAKRVDEKLDTLE